MVLSIDQIRELIKNPKNGASLEKAVKHQQRISFHAQAVDRATDANPYYKDFLTWVKDGIKLPKDKYDVFVSLLRFPLHTTSLISSIFDEFTTIFSAQDSYRDYQFANPDFRAEFDAYLSDNGVADYISGSLFQAFKERHNSVLIVDLPAVQTTDRPQPYFYELPIERVVDIDVRERAGQESIEYIIFKTDNKDELACFDEANFWLFQKNNDGEYINTALVPHTIGYCPAAFLSAQPLSTSNRITRKSPLTESATDLDWLLFLKTAKRQFEIYGAFPIMWSYSSDCDFTDEWGNACASGFVSGRREDGTPYNQACPACAQKNLVGPGTVLDVPAPRNRDEVDLREPAGIIEPSINSLKQLTEETDKVEWDIFTNVVGGVDGVMNKQAINEIQASAIVESKRKKYIYVSGNFEKVEKFIVDTFARLMYPGYYETSTINYGSQFDLYTTENVQKQMDALKKTGVPEFVLDQMMLLYIQSANRNNYNEQQRQELLKILEPYPTMSIAEVVRHGLKDVDIKTFLLKANFAKFVSDFESANGDIVSWGNALSPDIKIERLRKTLTDYVEKLTIDVREPGQREPAPVS